MKLYQFLLCFGFITTSTLSIASNCLVTGGKKIGDCENVHVGAAKPLNVTISGTYSGNYTRVVIQSGVNAYISGNTEDVIVRSGASLNLSGNSDRIHVEGVADLSGNTGWIHVEKGGQVTIRGIADGVSGPGKIRKISGAIIGGSYIK